MARQGRVGRAWRGRGSVATAALLLTALSGCDAGGVPAETVSSPSVTAPSPSISDASPSVSPTGSASTSPAPTATGDVVDPEHAVPPPGPLSQSLLPPDLMVSSEQPLTEAQLAAVADVPGVTQTEVMSLAQVGVENRVITVAAVDPATYRRYAPRNSAEEPAVWERIAGGELAVTPWLGRRLVDAADFIRLGNDVDAPRVHVGALAPQIPRVDAVVNETWIGELGMPAGNALLVSTGSASPQKVQPRLERLLGPKVSVQILGPDLDIGVQQTALLTGGSVAEAVGSFSYTVLAHGRIAPDAAWVAANIRTEQVPILGAVTCHRILFPQLRAALTEVVQRGLADKIHPGEYAGCYYPRFIAGTNQLSLHAFGIALDLNVPGNRRGTVGEIDRTVVSIFQRWGFTWGGDWGYTDPMHFELNALKTPSG